MVATRLMTAEELEMLPDDGYKYELVRGELIRMRPTGFEHIEVTGLLIHYLNAFVLPGKLGVIGGEGGFVLERRPDTVRAPDVVFVRMERVPRGEAAKHYVEGPPDLAIEVRSPSDTMRELIAKADEYLAAGTRLVWVFDTKTRTVVVKTPDGQATTLGIEDDLDGGDVLPGLRLPVATVFPER